MKGGEEDLWLSISGLLFEGNIKHVDWYETLNFMSRFSNVMSRFRTPLTILVVDNMCFVNNTFVYNSYHPTEDWCATPACFYLLQVKCSNCWWLLSYTQWSTAVLCWISYSHFKKTMSWLIERLWAILEISSMCCERPFKTVFFCLYQEVDVVDYKQSYLLMLLHQ